MSESQQTTVIEPHKPDLRKLRIAAYCRVSSLSQEQMHSFDTQVEHYRTLFDKDDSVELVGIFSDAGISGTQSATREGFMRMIDDCRNGRIDQIWTKSVSRFGRNTVDTLIYTRELRSLGIDVYFEKENIHTTEPGGEMLLTLLAAFAESEMESHSQNVKWGKHRRFENGLVEVINISNTMGFLQVNGVVSIVESEAEIVRRIYREYLDGYNVYEIAKRLAADGVPTKKSAQWTGTQVNNVLKNEKYAGDCLLQKSFTVDPIQHLRVRNRGELNQYFVEGCYPAIIEKEIWLVVQEMLQRYNTNRMNSREEYPFTGKMVCSVCGKGFIQYSYSGHNHERTIAFRCQSHKDTTGIEVPGKTYYPYERPFVIQDPSPELIEYRKTYAKRRKSKPRPYLCSDTRIPFDQPKKAFVQAWNLMISHKYRYLPLLERKADDEDILVRYFSGVLRKLVEDGERLEEFDARLFRKTVERIIVLPTAKLTFQFKAGVEITV